MPKVAYTEEQKVKIIDRALDYMKRNPETTRNKVAMYSGVAVTVLEKWGVELPKPIIFSFLNSRPSAFKNS